MSNQRGDILTAEDKLAQLIQTNRLRLNADTGSIGTTASRVNVELVQTDGRPFDLAVEAARTPP